MNMLLAENIRAFRRERKLTQEQLAEVLGVTTGAVHKWEAKLSVPDIELIVRMADLFDTSVDVLLGYEMKDNRMESTVQRLREYRRKKDRAGLEEAEKAIKKYPHSFKVVNECATIYRAFGIEGNDSKLSRRALELTEKALMLIGQNEDPEISEQTIYGKIAEIYLGLGETDKGIELLKAHNAGGMYNGKIGLMLAQIDRLEESAPFLSESMARLTSDIISTVVGYMNYYLKRGDIDSGRAILEWGSSVFAGLRRGDKPNYLDKVNSVFTAAVAGTHMMSGNEDEARRKLEKAKELAEFFDSAPSYDESDVRFIERIEGASVHDDIGPTAMEAVDTTVSEFENEALSALWESIRG